MLMSKPYKALQNKAFHNGAIIRYGLANGSTWTTNDQIMVRKIIPPEELQLLKNQIDARGVPPVDIQFILDDLNFITTSKIISGDDWTNAAGLNLIKSKSADGWEVNVQQVYVDYMNALFDDVEWYMTEEVVLAEVNGEVVAVIAKVNKIEGDE